MRRLFFCGFLICAACAQTSVPGVAPTVETDPVASRDDAADDPAIWINEQDPGASLILGTDKQTGLYVYDLSGKTRQFLPTGAVNNVDLRQGVNIGEWSGDLAAASNRTDNTIALYAIENGAVRDFGAFSSVIEEPYGLCMGVADGAATVFVAYKTGDLIAYRIDGPDAGAVAGRFKLSTQLEGCVHDDAEGVLYVGEELRGVWKATYHNEAFSKPMLVDETGGESGVAADVEGLAIYRSESAKYLIASSQGNDSFAAYDLADGSFVGRFAIVTHGGIDGAEETDGIEATSASLGSAFPKGVLVVQDGHNHPRGQQQNFKIVDWREIETALGLTP